MPAIVVMIPVDEVILRTRLLFLSHTYTLPEASTETPIGLLSDEDVAATLSPLLVPPLPAIVVMMHLVLGLRLG